MSLTLTKMLLFGIHMEAYGIMLLKAIARDFSSVQTKSLSIDHSIF